MAEAAGAKKHHGHEEDGAGPLSKMFREGLQNINTKRSADLFRELDGRSLTADEENIIAERLALQRRMLAEYEQRDRARKVRELMDICTGLTEAEATCALEQKQWREDDAAAALTAGVEFLHRVQTLCSTARRPLAAAALNSLPMMQGSVRPSRTPAPPPKSVDVASLALTPGVFLGSFRGKLLPMAPPPPQPRVAQAKPEGSNACRGRPRKLPAHNTELSPTLSRSHGARSKRRRRGGSPQLTDESATDLVSAETADIADAAVAHCTAGSNDSLAAGACSPAPAAQTASCLPIEQAAAAPLPTEAAIAAAAHAQQILQHCTNMVELAPAAAAEQQDAAAASNTAAVCNQQDGLRSAQQPAALGMAHLNAEELNSVEESNRAAQLYPAAAGAAATCARGRPYSREAAEGRPQQRGAQAALEAGAGPAPLPAPRPTQAEALTTCPAKAHAAQQQQQHQASDARSARGSSSEAVSSARDEQTEEAVRRAAREKQEAEDAALAAALAAAMADEEGLGESRTSRAARRAAGVKRSAKRIPEPEFVAKRARITKRTKLATFAGGAAVPGPEASAAADLADTSTAGATAATAAATAGISQAATENAADAFDEGAAQVAASRGDHQAGQAASGAPAAAQGAEVPAGEVTEPDAQAAEEVPPPASPQAANPWGTLTTRQSRRFRVLPPPPHAVPGSKAAGSNKSPAAPAAPGPKPRLGRVKRCSNKVVDLIEAGELVDAPGWRSAGYIIPAGFTSHTVFRSSVAPDKLTGHTCRIIGQGGTYFPGPTFQIVAADRPDEPLEGKSATGAWNAILNRINGCIEARRGAGESLPPPPKTAVAGPEYFGLTHPAICAVLEQLDPERVLAEYWAGKDAREAYARGDCGGSRPIAVGPQPPSQPRPAVSRRGRPRIEEMVEDDVYTGANRWSGVDRAARARRRAALNEDDEAAAAEVVDEDNPCPEIIDPITLEPVVSPGISPYGHVMGMATWSAVLTEQRKCPFTQQHLRRDQITALTKQNFERYQDRIVSA